MEIALDERPIAYALGSGESDEVALYAGIKPLIRQVLPAAEIAAARARFGALGLHLAEADHRVDLASTQGRVLFVGRDAARVRAAAACEAAPDHDRELGKLLGYPRCCVEAYLDLPPPRGNGEVAVRAFATTRGSFAPRLNTLDLAVFHYVSWLPCSFSCALSRAFADAVARHIAERHGQFLGGAAPRVTCPPDCRHQRFVRAIDEALSAHRLVLHEDVQVSLRGPFDGTAVTVQRAFPTARDRHPEATIAGDAREAALRLATLVHDAGTVAVDGDVLVIDGAAVLRSPSALLVPFGAG
ncbi:Hypothetical protein A7982_05156 [Minicystis rosea]|nr:Hypothetical protein A7982_05156 [Minicystis rosea]